MKPLQSNDLYVKRTETVILLQNGIKLKAALLCRTNCPDDLLARTTFFDSSFCQIQILRNCYPEPIILSSVAQTNLPSLLFLFVSCCREPTVYSNACLFLVAVAIYRTRWLNKHRHGLLSSDSPPLSSPESHSSFSDRSSAAT
ncbi:hypothetical protein L596_023948 [Steinernema carpocapsae]|uniref:Uncharacterized protein n=1 Tax=Steinernema carpocapsae TaxID=34508 RepID=A0A4U5MF96_STECR|nr:hypothetical protein L596_023948 [Steinernema carpocapsae]